MAIKKVLAAVGLVCVVAPAALAINNEGRGFDDFREMRDRLAEIIGLQALVGGPGSVGEGHVPSRRAPDLGEARFHPLLVPTWSFVPRLADLEKIRFDAERDPFAHGFVDIASVISKAAAVTSGPVEGGTAASQASGGAHPGGSSGTVAGPNASGGPGLAGASLGGGGGGGGSSGQTLEEIELLDGEAPPEETVTVMPVPPSVWMLLGAIAGLGFVGYRRRAAA
jgi:hypothetical protein